MTYPQRLKTCLRNALIIMLALAGSMSEAAAAGVAPAAEAPLALSESRTQAQDADRHWLQRWFVREEHYERYGLVVPGSLSECPQQAPLVVVLHGFNSKAEGVATLVSDARAAGTPCGEFTYPNDDHIARSAERLSTALRRLRAEHPDREVALVTHSMGGLVARACVEDSRLDPGNVGRLIMVAPPNQGSELVRLAYGTDCWEHWTRCRGGGWPWTRVHNSLVDGLGEASADMTPGSPFLSSLNKRPRNPRVRYTILLGDCGFLSESTAQSWRERTCYLVACAPWCDDAAERLDRRLAGYDELVIGRGDGAVAVCRGRLEGVDDTVVLPFGHLDVTRKPDSPEGRAVRKLIHQRLAWSESGAGVIEASVPESSGPESNGIAVAQTADASLASVVSSDGGA
ncbi:Alpha/beta hydrolase family protein [Pseudobythopirellula maris]|uniref:Alpha/beta hydrolase family protein n=1 Tax=Pseudobythopirellula maris TaxID=2527991 RepID=A0A5C5ZLB0_9BACT|nr:alpha/beta fold hydrolase [Pseudobythopirellula maris]TWT87591.1 Alpha/beta hydrolase family protein [Pseudobythopirellula maris]